MAVLLMLSGKYFRMEKNLSNEEALKKFKKLVKEVNVCMFITNSKENNHTRPMATIEVEDNGTLWFFTDIRSIKVEEVNTTHKAHLVYAHPVKESYLDVWGDAFVVNDNQTLIGKWSPIAKAWFPKGVDDPNLALLKIRPQEAYYWDAEAGKMVSFLKIMAGAVTGRPAFSNDAKGSLSIKND